MIPTVLATNGGPHPADKWAYVSAERITPVDTDITGDRLLEVQKLRVKIADALVEHHAKVQADERAHLKTKGDARFDDPHGPLSSDLDAATDAVVDIGKQSPFAEHFAKPAVRDAIRGELGSHFATVQHIERLWHADRNRTPAGEAYRARYHGPRA